MDASAPGDCHENHLNRNDSAEIAVRVRRRQRLIGGQPTNHLDMLIVRVKTDDGLTGGRGVRARSRAHDEQRSIP